MEEKPDQALSNLYILGRRSRLREGIAVFPHVADMKLHGLAN
jgi:hypothetical protein